MWFFNKKDKENKHNLTDQERKESVTVRRLRKDNQQLEGLLDTKDKRIESLERDLKEFYEGKQSNKLFDVLEKILAPKNPAPIPNQQTLTNEFGFVVPQSKVDLPDDQIAEIISSIGEEKISQIISLGDDKAKKIIKSRYPQFSEKTLNRGLEIARGIL